MKPSAVLSQKRDVVRAIAQRFHTLNPRVFGSVAKGLDHEGSDLDLLVDAPAGVTLFDLGAMQIELEAALEVDVDLRTPGDLPLRFRAQVLNEARAV